MRRIFLLPLFFLFSLGLCGCVYHPDVQQGNIITNKDLRALHKGMTADEVRSLLKDPILENIYADNRMVYVYTFQHEHEKMTEKRLIVYFRNHRVTNYWTDMKSPGSPIAIPHP